MALDGNSSTLDIGNSNSWKDITFEITSQTYGNNIEVDYISC